MPLSNPQVIVDRLSLKRRRLVAWLVGTNVGVALLLGLLVALVIGKSRDAYLAEARNAAEHIAAVAQLDVAREFEVVDAVVRATADELQRRPQDPARADPFVDELLRTRLGWMKGVESFRLTDSAGRVRWGTGLPADRTTDVSDRDYFQQARTHREDRTIVTGPLRSRVSGHWVLGFVRPLRVDGRFDGVLYVSVAVDHLRDSFSRYGLAPKDAVTLRSHDLRLVARYAPGSGVQGDVGTVMVSDELRRVVGDRPSAGTFVSRVAIDGEVRTTAYRSLAGWPFTVYGGISHDRFFAGWVRQAWTVGLLAALSWLMVVAATLLVYRSSAREARALQALADQTHHTKNLLRIAGDGIQIVNHEGRLVEMSDSFAEMLGSTRERMLGRHISSWDVNQDEEKIARWLAKIRDGDKQRVDVQHRREDGTILDVELQMRVADVGGQLMVFGSGRDVTAIKRLVREQTAMLESELVAMAKVEHRHLTWRNAAFEKLFGYEVGELAGRSARDLYRDDETFHRVGLELYGALARGGQYRAQLRMSRKNGEPVWVDYGAVQLADGQVLLMAIDITASKEAEARLAHVAFHDALTGLPNRLLLSDRLNQALATARREQLHVAVGYMDLDGFKAVNDDLGHDAGDALLREVGRRLQGNIRPSDTASRIGGDEFVVVLGGVGGEEWRAVLERLVRALEAPVTLPDGAVVQVGVTMGVTLSEEADTDAALLDRADRVMLQGKRTGKGRIFTG